MPIYTYECQDCNEKFEAFGSIKEDTSIAGCPKCIKGLGRKIPSLTSFHLSGDGWYRDSYNGPSNKVKK